MHKHRGGQRALTGEGEGDEHEERGGHHGERERVCGCCRSVGGLEGRGCKRSADQTACASSPAPTPHRARAPAVSVHTFTSHNSHPDGHNYALVTSLLCRSAGFSWSAARCFLPPTLVPGRPADPFLARLGVSQRKTGLALREGQAYTRCVSDLPDPVEPVHCIALPANRHLIYHRRRSHSRASTYPRRKRQDGRQRVLPGEKKRYTSVSDFK